MFPAVPYSRYVIGSLPWYSVLVVTGIAVAILLCTREEKRLGLPKDMVLDLALTVVPFGVIGARLYYVLFSWEIFAPDPLSVLYVWQGGLAIYGGVIGGVIAVLIFARMKKLNALMLTDMIVPTVALAQAIGRWGNYFNMEAYGAPITDPAWQFFPAGVLIPSAEGYAWHMATFFYESMWNMCVFCMLWFVIRKRKKTHGVVTLWYALLYGVGRAIIEGLRTDSLMAGSFRVSQLLSASIAATALVILIILGVLGRRQTRKNTEASSCPPTH